MRIFSCNLTIAVILYSQAACLGDEREPLRAEALERARSIRVVLPGDKSAVELAEEPVLRFGEPTRGNEDGSLWHWGQSGRPLVFAEIYRSVGDKVLWAHAISLTSTQLVSAQTAAGRWTPRNSQLKLQPIADVPLPFARAVARLRQMKELAQQFDAHEFWEPDNTRYPLRCLPRPVHRYDDVGAGLLDGAVFVFTHGTNPEILLFVEAHVKDGEPARWHCGFAPMGSAELHVMRNNKDVWTQPRAPGVVGRPTDPYWLFVAAVPGEANGKNENDNR